MTPRRAAVIAVLATTTLVGGFCAWFLRPEPEIDRLKTFPRAMAEAVAAADFTLAASRLAPEFRWLGAEPCGKDEALDRLRRLVEGGKFFPAVATSEAVRADDGVFRLVVYGVIAEGDPTRERRPPVRAFRLEALAAVRDGGVVLLEAGP